MTSFITKDLTDGVLTLTFARPDKKNAITNDMYGVLADALAEAESQPAIRVVLFQGDGDLFTAGNDLGEFAAMATGGFAGERHVVRFIQALAGATRPLVAAVQGKAVGIGTTMLLHCDYVLLAEDALLTAPFVNLALVPEAASSLLLPARIGHVRAFGMFALGEAVDAATALAAGLANQVVPAAGLRDAARAVAGRLARQPAGAISATKRLMRDGQAMLAQIAAENQQFFARLATAEAREAFTAFAERRPPDFSRFS